MKSRTRNKKGRSDPVLFKIEKGKIRRIEAVFQQAPFGILSGWSTYQQSIGEEIQSVR